MADSKSAPKLEVSGRGWTWLATLGVVFAVSWALGLLNDTTQLTPDSSPSLTLCFALATIAGLLSALVTFSQTKGEQWRRTCFAIAPGLFGCLAVLLFFINAFELAESKARFPPRRTRTYEALLLIDRAYQTHGKGRSWNIQTTPIWSNLDITRTDYEFMLANREPDDAGKDPDEISSRGHFCARVTLQQAGDAVQVLKAGTHRLPQGTVEVCPSE